VDPRVYEALSQPVVGLRDPYFLEVMSDIQAGLREVFGTTNEKVFLVPASGSGAMETAIANFVLPQSKFLIFTAGVFSERIATMAERQRARVVRVERAWGEIFTAEEAQQAIDREHPDAVAFVQAETSTGAYQSGKAIAPHASEAGALVIADCVTSLGAMPVELDSVGIDVAFSCSQKGLSCPAGLSPITFSPRAVERLAKRTEPLFTWYFDLQLMDKYFDEPHSYQHTPSPPLYYAVHQALAVIEEEGLRNRWERHKRAGERLVRGLEKLGFTPLIKDPEQRLWHLSTVVPPSGVDEAKLRETLLRKHGIEVAAGLGKLAGKILRIGTMGPLATEENVDTLLAAISTSL
jgi:alanine-glyoxylate transaminase/serine-glyoxylate transaminase/serine-pyruvate transaminase